jgi:hypothetical protein
MNLLFIYLQKYIESSFAMDKVGGTTEDEERSESRAALISCATGGLRWKCYRSRAVRSAYLPIVLSRSREGRKRTGNRGFRDVALGARPLGERSFDLELELFSPFRSSSDYITSSNLSSPESTGDSRSDPV